MRALPLVVSAAALAIAGAAAAQSASGDLKFSYSTPPQARAIPGLKAWLDTAAARDRVKYAHDATADRINAAKTDRPFHPYEAERHWQVVTDTPRFLSLSLVAYEYTGGAHGMTTFDGLVWDKAAKQHIAPLAFFTSKQALTAAVKPAFCRELDAQRRAKRNGESGGLAEFDKCIDPAGETVILGSSNHRRFDRIGFLIAPYDAGPYAEGKYEVTLPVTSQVIAAVKPQWRRYFAVKR